MNKSILALTIFAISFWVTDIKERTSAITVQEYRNPASIKKVEQKALTELSNSFEQLAKSLEGSNRVETKEDLDLVQDMTEKLRKDTEIWQ